LILAGEAGAIGLQFDCLAWLAVLNRVLDSLVVEKFLTSIGALPTATLSPFEAQVETERA
jgi:hypothetical protein